MNVADIADEILIVQSTNFLSLREPRFSTRAEIANVKAIVYLQYSNASFQCLDVTVHAACKLNGSFIRRYSEHFSFLQLMVINRGNINPYEVIVNSVRVSSFV